MSYSDSLRAVHRGCGIACPGSTPGPCNSREGNRGVQGGGQVVDNPVNARKTLMPQACGYVARRAHNSKVELGTKIGQVAWTA